MLQDPRHRNVRFDSSNIQSYIEGYATKLRDAVLSIDASAVNRACIAIEDAAIDGRRIYAIGNGGSAAIADHLSCDCTKGTYHLKHPTIDTLSMTSNVALYSAIANDFGFEKVFSTQIGFLGKQGDVLIAISSSGNSANISKAVEAAEALGMTTIGLSGFTGGVLRATSQISLHVDAHNYGIVEDAHQSIMHILAQFIAGKRDAAAND
jgi:D-sedoheptulose 7-phosphate isomerase